MRGDVFQDWLDPLAVDLDTFCRRFTGSWVFDWALALSQARVDTLILCTTTRVSRPLTRRHEPSGALLAFIPVAPPSSRAVGRLAAHLRPYVRAPIRPLVAALRASSSRALVVQDFESPGFDVAVVAGRLAGVPVFATFQGGHRVSVLEPLFHQVSAHLARGFVVGPQSEIEAARRRYRLPASRFARIFNPVDASFWQPGDSAAARRELNLPPRSRVLAWHGRVEIKVKGLDVLLEAWSRVRARVSDARLILLGSGGDADALRSLVTPFDDIHWFPRFSHEREEVRRLLRAADAYVLPSRQEGFPVAPLEAMACGLPVIAADAHGVRDMLGEGADSPGVIVPVGDAAGLSESITALLGSQERLERLGRCARERTLRADLDPRCVGAALAAFLLGAETW